MCCCWRKNWRGYSRVRISSDAGPWEIVRIAIIRPLVEQALGSTKSLGRK